MELDRLMCLVLLLLVAGAVSARKGRKKEKKNTAPQWKSDSMPYTGKRFESVREGTDLKLNCKVQARPKASIKWFKDGERIKSTDKMEVKKFGLHLKGLTTDMSGNYSCSVKNDQGQLDWTFHIDVQATVWPLVVEGPHNITQMVGSRVTFRCKVVNDPRATIRWQKINKGPAEDENAPQANFLPDNDNPEVLTLDNIQKEDEGEYRCMTGNVWGLKYSSAWLTVIEPVIRPEVPSVIEMDKDETGTFDEDLDETENADLVEGTKDPYFDGGLRPYDFGPDPYGTPTKRPRNHNKGKGKNGKRKDKKDKGRNRQEEVSTPGVNVHTMAPQPATTANPITKPEIWTFNHSNEFEGISDTRYNSVNKNTEQRAGTGNTGSATSRDNEIMKGSISSWTIYTIVGAVGGVILLIGLVAITLALCCKKEEGGVYKSTPV